MLKKNIIYVMMCLSIALLLTGCNSKDKGNSNHTVTTVPTQAAILTPVATPSTELTIAPPENMEITIYTLSPDSLEKEAVTVLVTVEDELTPELIVEQVLYAMEDEGFYLGINDIIINGDSVRIDFLSDAVPVTDVGASVEGSIIDILAQSILDNLPQYKKIYISIEGGPYHSGHLEFELDDVYLGR